MKRWIIASREDLGRCRNKIGSNIVPRWNKKYKNSGWNLGRDGSGRIQSMIPRRNKWDRYRREWCANGILVNHHIPDRNSHNMWDHSRMGHLERKS
jgi:hypothetical protein